MEYNTQNYGDKMIQLGVLDVKGDDETNENQSDDEVTINSSSDFDNDQSNKPLITSSKICSPPTDNDKRNKSMASDISHTCSSGTTT